MCNPIKSREFQLKQSGQIKLEREGLLYENHYTWKKYIDVNITIGILDFTKHWKYTIHLQKVVINSIFQQEMQSVMAHKNRVEQSIPLPHYKFIKILKDQTVAKVKPHLPHEQHYKNKRFS